MKKFSIGFSVLFVAAFLGVVACGDKKTAQADPPAELIDLNKRYDSALLNQDTAVLRSMYATDFIYTNPDGRVLNKEQQLLNVATSEMKWESGGSDEIKVSVYGNMAILTGAFRARGSYRANPLTVQERYTSVWIKTDTSWLMVAEHSNIIRQ